MKYVVGPYEGKIETKMGRSLMESAAESFIAEAREQGYTFREAMEKLELNWLAVDDGVNLIEAGEEEMARILFA